MDEILARSQKIRYYMTIRIFIDYFLLFLPAEL